MPMLPALMDEPSVPNKTTGLTSYYKTKIELAEQLINSKTANLVRPTLFGALQKAHRGVGDLQRRLEATRNTLNSKVRLLREEIHLLQEPGSYVGEVVKLMGKKKVRSRTPSCVLRKLTGVG